MNETTTRIKMQVEFEDGLVIE